MTRKYEIRLGTRIIALAYVSPHPYLQDRMVASVFPITRTANAEDLATELDFGPLSHEDFSSEMAPDEMIRQLVTSYIDGAATRGFVLEEVELLREAKT